MLIKVKNLLENLLKYTKEESEKYDVEFLTNGEIFKRYLENEKI